VSKINDVCSAVVGVLLNLFGIFNDRAFASFLLQVSLLICVLGGLTVLRRDAIVLVLGPLRRMLKIVARCEFRVRLFAAFTLSKSFLSLDAYLLQTPRIRWHIPPLLTREGMILMKILISHWLPRKMN